MPPSDDDKHLELLEKVLSKVDGTQTSLNKIDKRLDLHIQKTEFELQKINELDAQQNMLLDKHIEGVRTLREMHASHLTDAESRFDRLEAPWRWIKATTRVMGYISAICAAIAGVMKLFGML